MSKRKSNKSTSNNKKKLRRSTRCPKRSVSHKFKSLFYGQPNVEQLKPYGNVKCVHTKPNIYVIDNFIPSVEDLFHVMDENKWSKSFVGDHLVTDYRTSSYMVVPPSTITRKIDEKVCNMVGGFEDYIEPLQIIKYDQGQQNDVHHDSGTIYNDGTIELTPPVRYITLFVYLNDLEEEDGGGTYFPELDLRIQPKRGRAVMFPNLNPDGTINEKMIHAGEPILSTETKYGMNIWICGQKVK